MQSVDGNVEIVVTEMVSENNEKKIENVNEVMEKDTVVGNDIEMEKDNVNCVEKVT